DILRVRSHQLSELLKGQQPKSKIKISFHPKEIIPKMKLVPKSNT
ncbi:unnamed protein product, partial [Callosobruchus maculatus]